MDERRTHLKVKIKNLADEARTIRVEENRCEETIRHLMETEKINYRCDCEAWHEKMGLANHRRFVVRPAARLNQLAAAFLRGTPYLRVEAKTRTPFSVAELHKLIKKFGDEKTEIISVHDWLAGRDTARLAA